MIFELYQVPNKRAVFEESEYVHVIFNSKKLVRSRQNTGACVFCLLLLLSSRIKFFFFFAKSREREKALRLLITRCYFQCSSVYVPMHNTFLFSFFFLFTPRISCSIFNALKAVL